MIGLKMTYYPPSAANEEPISIERTLTVRTIMATPGTLEATVVQLYSTLVDNSEELQEVVYAVHTEAFDLIQINKD